MTMSCFLFGTIFFFILFILRRFTHFNIFEAEQTLKKKSIEIEVMEIEPIDKFNVQKLKKNIENNGD